MRACLCFPALPVPRHSHSKGSPRVLPRIITGSLIAALLASSAMADTLRDALVSAYQSNPTLTGQRENLKATDANVAIAKAAGRPQVTASVGLNRDLSRRGILNTGGAKKNSSGGGEPRYPFFKRRPRPDSGNAAQTPGRAR